MHFFIITKKIQYCFSLLIRYVFAGIYSIELIVKVISCGFCFGSYTYLRDPWNWLDFTLIILSYIFIILKLKKVLVLENIFVLKLRNTQNSKLFG